MYPAMDTCGVLLIELPDGDWTKRTSQFLIVMRIMNFIAVDLQSNTVPMEVYAEFVEMTIETQYRGATKMEELTVMEW